MAGIPDKDRTAFKEAAFTVLDNFTPRELGDLEIAAQKITDVIKQAQSRQQEKLRNTA